MGEVKFPSSYQWKMDQPSSGAVNGCKTRLPGMRDYNFREILRGAIDMARAGKKNQHCQVNAVGSRWQRKWKRILFIAAQV